jgi:hypothetical protein
MIDQFLTLRRAFDTMIQASVGCSCRKRKLHRLREGRKTILEVLRRANEGLLCQTDIHSVQRTLPYGVS